MKYFLLACLPILFFSCKKETLKDNENFKHFVGIWESEEENEKLRIEFTENGQIMITNEIDRIISYYPNISASSLDVNFKTNGQFWLIYSFDLIKKSKKIIDGGPILVNPGYDTMFYNYKSIENFVAQPTYSTLLIKKK